MSHDVGYSPNAEFWVRIMRERLDRYRTELTDPAVLAALGDVTGKRVLDAGCGEGYLARLLAGRGALATGLDLDAGLIQAAQALEATQPLGIEFTQASIDAIPADPATFDAVVANHVVNDIEDLDSAFGEIGRVLKPGGRFVILALHPCFYWARRGFDETDPTWPDVYFDTLPRLQSFNVAGIESPGQVKAWYRPLEDYGSALAGNGFVIIDLQEPHPTSEQRRDPWWAAGWSKPMFLLIAAQNRP